MATVLRLPPVFQWRQPGPIRRRRKVQLALVAAIGLLALGETIAGYAGLLSPREAPAPAPVRPLGLSRTSLDQADAIHAREAAAQACQIACEGTVTASDGGTVKVAAKTICLHGDTPGAPAIAAAVRAALEAQGVAIRPLVEKEGAAKWSPPCRSGKLPAVGRLAQLVRAHGSHP